MHHPGDPKSCPLKRAAPEGKIEDRLGCRGPKSPAAVQVQGDRISLETRLRTDHPPPCAVETNEPKSCGSPDRALAILRDAHNRRIRKSIRLGIIPINSVPQQADS